MFPGLRHDTVIGSYHQQAHLDAGHPPDHILHQPVVPRNIDQGDIAGQEGKADVDGHAPAFLLGLGVGIHTGEGLDQGRLAMVDVAGQTDD